MSVNKSNEVVLCTVPAGTMINSVDGLLTFRPPGKDPFYFEARLDWTQPLGLRFTKQTIPTPEALKRFA